MGRAQEARIELADNVRTTAAALAQNASQGRVTPSVHTRYEGAVEAVSRFEQYGRAFELRCDESVERGGRGSAPSPMRYLLSSVAFCMQVWCAKTAALHGVTINEMAVDADALLDMRGEHLVDGVPAHPQWMTVHVVLETPASSADVEQTVREAAQRCPITALMAKALPLHLAITHNGTIILNERPGNPPGQRS